MQEDHPVVFNSHKFSCHCSDTASIKYITTEQEIIGLVNAMKAWRGHEEGNYCVQLQLQLHTQAQRRRQGPQTLRSKPKAHHSPRQLLVDQGTRAAFQAAQADAASSILP